MPEKIVLKDVSFRYKGNGERNGVSHINLSIHAGEVVLIAGTSGCGKTTIARLINGLIPHFYEGDFSGDVRIEHRGTELSVRDTPLYALAGVVGSVFQNPRSQFFNVDTDSEIAFGCENLGMQEDVIRERVAHTAGIFQLRDLLGRSIFELSGGEKQRIACASAYALSPDIYVLDEPSSNLDLSAMRELRGILDTMKAEGATIVIAEHRLSYLNGLADRVIVMEEGKIVQEYTAAAFADLSAEKMEHAGLRPFGIFCEPDVPLRMSRVQAGTLRFEDFVYTYKNGKKALSIPLMEVPENEIVAVTGRNGAGKTTFARGLCGLNRMKKSRLSYRGKRYSDKKRMSLCYLVMQDVGHQLFTEDVLDEVMISMPEEDGDKAREILTSLDLEDHLKKHPMALSGGEKQRLAVACAIASERGIIVFDEPTSGLDLRHMKEVAESLRILREQKKSVFVITHDPELIRSCCTYEIRMENGCVKESGYLS